MSIAADCATCAMGNHDGHNRDHGIIEGVIGGTYCACTGDCAERFKAEGDRIRTEWFGATAASTDAGGLSDEDTEWVRRECQTCRGGGCNHCEHARDRIDRLVSAAATRARAEGAVAERERIVQAIEALASEYGKAMRDHLREGRPDRESRLAGQIVADLRALALGGRP